MDPVRAGPARPQAGSGLSVEAPTLPAPADLLKPENPLSAARAPEPWPPAPRLAAAEPQPPPAARRTRFARRIGQAPKTTEPAVHPKEARREGDLAGTPSPTDAVLAGRPTGCRSAPGRRGTRRRPPRSTPSPPLWPPPVRVRHARPARERGHGLLVGAGGAARHGAARRSAAAVAAAATRTSHRRR